MESLNYKSSDNKDELKIKKEEPFISTTVSEEMWHQEMKVVYWKSESIFENSDEAMKIGEEDIKTEVHKQRVGEEINGLKGQHIWDCEGLVDVKKEVDEDEDSQLNAGLELKDNPDQLGCKSYEDMLTNNKMFDCKSELHHPEIKIESSFDDETVPNIFHVKQVEGTFEEYSTENHLGLESSEKDKQSVEICDPESSQLYKCMNCSYLTTRQHHLVSHMNCTHSEHAKVYKCNNCTYETKSRRCLIGHIKRQHDKNRLVYKCKDCPYETNCDSYLKKHMKIHDKSVLYKCKLCTYETQLKSNLKKHVKRMHEADGVLYQCEDCTFETKCESDLMKHIERKHVVKSALYKCKDCTYETKWKANLIHHTKRKHGAVDVLYKCEYCTYETKCQANQQKDIQRRHYSNVGHTVLHKCKECKYETKCKSNLTKHVKRTHEVICESHKCEECTFETKDKAYLREHIKRKHGVDSVSYKCEYCTHETKCQAYLKKHMKIHHSNVDRSVLNKYNKCTYETKFKPDQGEGT